MKPAEDFNPRKEAMEHPAAERAMIDPRDAEELPNMKVREAEERSDVEVNDVEELPRTKVVAADERPLMEVDEAAERVHGD